ncbi:rhodanese-related sulfurtransferase [Salicibibacter kimchii]|uniref:tRNA uridine(34) hydroxylase n=1 Tax=Salicibibacter kimchii TaxID=2099786 RepID=A0A345C2Z8_9BACI|nr:rhodanese-related sulfurtransferase [Salicibibacter kimchii]AXF57579.1 rhodanese-related sulfurtransferase [Salicibibacter kimchii]
MDDQKNYRVLLYYKYVDMLDYEEYAEAHLQYCKDLGLRGRIIVAPEGLNGTVSGTIEQTEAYMEYVKSDPRFSDMDFKIDEAEGHAFKKIFVRPKKEIVTWRLEDDVNPNDIGGEYLTPKEFHEALQEEETVVIDGRNDYEYEIGHFRNAIKPEVGTSREFPEWIEENIDHFKGKKVITYCTGGIRCEKLTGILKQKGVDDVYQLHGGIVNYSQDEEVKGHLFDGKCYVFDERISIRANHTEEDVVISSCHHCGKTEDRYINCSNPECNLQYVCCTDCEENHQAACCEECRVHPRNRWPEIRTTYAASVK